MNKIFGITLIVVALSSCASSPNGEVPVSTTNVTSQKPTTVNNTVNTTIQIFKLATEIATWPDGVTSGASNYQYDSEGRLIREETLNANKVVSSTRLYTYKPDGTIEIRTLNNKDNNRLVGISIKTYNENKLVTTSNFNANNVLQSKETWTYNPQGQKIRWTVDLNGSGVTNTEYQWQNDSIVASKISDSSMALIKTYRYQYNSKRKLEKEEEFDATGALRSRTQYFYQNEQLIRQDFYDRTGNILSSKTYENDSQGNALIVRYLDRKGTIYEIRTRTWTSFELKKSAIPLGVLSD